MVQVLSLCLALGWLYSSQGQPGDAVAPNGLVVDSHNHPMSGVTVVGIGGYGSWRDNQVLTVCKSDSDGIFHLPANPDVYRIIAVTSQGVESSTFDAPMPVFGQTVRLQVPDSSQIRLRLLDPVGKPLVRIHVSLGYVGSDPTQSVLGEPVTDAVGECVLTYGAETAALLKVEDGRYDVPSQQEILTFPIAGSTSYRVLKLVPATGVIGRVVEKDSGRPMPGVLISALAIATFYSGPGPWPIGRTDANGEYHFHTGGDLSCNILVSDPDLIPSGALLGGLGPGLTIQSVAGKTIRAPDLRVASPARVTFRVERVPPGESGEGFDLRLAPHSNWTAWTEVGATGPDGTVTRNLQPGSYHATIGDGQASFQVKSDETRVISVKVHSSPGAPRSASISRTDFVAVGSNGVPVPYAWIQREPYRGSDLTDAEGRAQLYDGYGKGVLTSKGGEASTPNRVPLTDMQVFAVQLATGRLAKVTGSVESPKSGKIGDARVEILIVSDWTYTALVATTSQDGRFEFDDLWPGTYVVRVSKDGERCESSAFQVRASQVRVLNPLTLGDGDSFVDGRVMLFDGSPAVGSYVHTPHAVAYTDFDGRFRLNCLRPGMCKVRVETQGRPSITVDAESGRLDQTFKVPH